MATADQIEYLETQRNIFINTITVFLPLYTKQQPLTDIPDSKKRVVKELSKKKEFIDETMYRTLVNLVEPVLKANIVSQVRAKSVAISVNGKGHSLSFLPYTLRPSIHYNRGISINTLLKQDKGGYKNYVVLSFKYGYINIYLGVANKLVLMTTLVNCGTTAFVNDADHFLNEYLFDKPLPVFVFGPQEQVSYYIAATVWRFNVVEYFITGMFLDEPMISGFINLWSRNRSAANKADNYDEAYTKGINALKDTYLN